MLDPFRDPALFVICYWLLVIGYGWPVESASGGLSPKNKNLPHIISLTGERVNGQRAQP